MNPYDPASWGEFGVALVGASAALTGLIFVAISISLREVLANPALPGRAGEGVLTLFVVLVACALLLVPGQDPTLLGLEWIVVGIAFGGWLLWLELGARGEYTGQRGVLVARVVQHQVAAGLFLLAGLTAVLHGPGGIYWIAPAALWTLGVGIIDAWVLLIEIHR